MKGLAAIALIAGFVGGAPAMATTVVYSGYDANTTGGAMLTSPSSDAAHASFTAALTNVLTQSFESYSSGARPSTLAFTGAGGSATASLAGSGMVIGNYPRANPVPSGGFAIDGSKFYSMEASSFTIGFANAVDAIGFYATDIESDLLATLTLASGATETYSFDQLFSSSTSPSGSVNFLGLANGAGITSLTLSNIGRYDALAFDQFQVGSLIAAVPEASTWGMMMFGMFGMGLALRRRPTGKALSHAA